MEIAPESSLHPVHGAEETNNRTLQTVIDSVPRIHIMSCSLGGMQACTTAYLCCGRVSSDLLLVVCSLVLAGQLFKLRVPSGSLIPVISYRALSLSGMKSLPEADGDSPGDRIHLDKLLPAI
jgi:hypothetical protein